MPRFAADRVLLAPIDDVWRFLAEPYNLGDWWPGIAGVEPDRRGLAPGARWKVVGDDQPTYFRRPQATGTLLVLDVAPMERLAFQLTGDRIDADLTLRALDERRTEVTLVVEGPWLIGLRRRFPAQALERLHALLRSGETE
ncbi:MAG TPA: SRPBCC domain-containing protein [Gaiellaceae bacterium]|nr:SRPBCC domain-containing protein [Gaiellaceae bacterium]